MAREDKMTFSEVPEGRLFVIIDQKGGYLFRKKGEHRGCIVNLYRDGSAGYGGNITTDSMFIESTVEVYLIKSAPNSKDEF